MTWKTMQPEGGAPAQAEQQRDQVEHELPADPGHVRTRQHYEAMLEELRAGQ